MDDDAALRDVVKKALEGKGVLAQIRASLRAAVFTVVDEHERTAGVHVPNPAALAVKHDTVGRLSLQVVADFLEHWELHQTLSVLKLETDMATEDLLSTEELGSIVADGAAVGSGETKTPEGKPSPVMLQLLAACRAAPRDKEKGFPLGAAAAAAGDQSERLVGEHKGREEEEGRQEAGEEEEEEDGGRRSTTWRGVGVEGVGVERDGVPPRVTLRKRRGDHGGTNGTSDSGMGNGSGGEDANEPASSVSSEPTSSATAGEGECDRQSRERENDGDAEESRFGRPLLREQPTAANDKNRGEDNGGGQGRWEHHFDGRMDESSYDFSENVESVRGAGEDPMVAAAVSGVDGGGGDGDGESISAAAAGGVCDRSNEGEEDDGPRLEEGDRFPRHSGANENTYDGGGGGGLRNGNGDSLAGFGGSSDNGGGVEKEPRSSVDGGVASGVDEWNEDYYEDDDFDGDEEEDNGNDEGDAGRAGGHSAADVAAKVAANDSDGEVEEEALLAGGDGTREDGLFDPEGSRGRVSAEEEERIADLEWEARVGLSADSSVSAGPMEEDGMDGPAYEIVDAQSI